MKKIIVSFVAICSVLLFSSCGVLGDYSTSVTSNSTIVNNGGGAVSGDEIREIPLPKSSYDYLWTNYEEVYNDFLNAGFTNIILEPIYDLTGDEWFTADGDCEDILVNGKSSFYKGDLYFSNVKITIKYHTYADNNPENSDKIVSTMNSADFNGLIYDVVEEKLKEMGFSKFEYEPLETEREGVENGTVYEVQTKGWLFNSKLVSGDKYDKDTTVIIKYYVVEEKVPNLTAENCSEFYELLQLKDPGHSSVADFARKYKGRIIEFDGAIYSIFNHGNDKTRFDILIGAGDFNSSSMRGPNFRLTDVGMLDMDLSIYDELEVGDNIRVIAEVGTYNSNTQLFELEIIKVEFRN